MVAVLPAALELASGDPCAIRVGGGELRLRIDADQGPWNPAKDGGLRVSALQTGQFSGPVGGRIGQLQFTDALVVQEAQPFAALYTPTYGLVEARLWATADPRT